MTSSLMFLLLYAGLMAFGSVCSAAQNQTCGTSAGFTAEQCTHMSNSTQKFLLCAGVPSELEADHVLNLKGLISAALDVYTFMRSSVSGVPLLDLSGGVSVDEDHVIRAWLDVKLTPLLSSISRNFLTCLSNRNFSCSAYQTVVKELSQHFSSLDPVRQKWIYSFFMYPFLSKNTSSGCVDPEVSSEDWLMKNFGSFSVMAQVRDFTSINMLFSGLEVLHLLSPEQKAELLLHPEMVGLADSSLSLVFQSLLSSLLPPENPSSDNSTMFYMSSVPSPSMQDPLRQALNGFMMAFRPVGSFVRDFVSLTHQQNLSSMRSATLMQAMINLTLAEIAAPFKQNSTVQQQVDQVAFDPTDVNDWFTYVVSPILRRFLPHDQTEIPSNITAVFHNQFYIETGMGSETQNQSQDICSPVVDDRTCALTDLVEHVSTILHCAARSNLTLTEETLLNVLLHLSQNLNALLQQLSMTNFSFQNPSFSDILNQIVDDSFTMQSLQDESFVRLWFQVKLKPLLSTLTPEYLSCLSHKEFNCQTFQLLVSEFSENMFLMSDGGPQIVYEYFIFSFLSQKYASGGCPAESSSVWVIQNLGGFSHFATLREIYQLNQDFNAIEAVPALSPRQTAELIVEDLPGLPEKSVIINIVFDYILISPEDRGLLEMLGHLIVLAGEMGLECSSYQQIVQRLQGSLSVTLPYMMQPLQEIIKQMEEMALPGCFPPPFTCISTPVNETSVCIGVNSNVTYLSAGLESVPCNISLEQFACSPLTGFTAENLAELLMCQLSSNSSYSKEIWKLLLTNTNDILDQALVIFSSMAENMPIRSESMSQVLDVIGELRLEQSSDQWNDIHFISMLVSQNLRPFLPYASPILLQCVSSKNLSCQTYQQLLEEFSLQFHLMNEMQRRNMVDFFILPFLRRNTTDPGCVFSSNNSTEWLLRNFGLFAKFVPLRDLLSINSFFDPLENLVFLSAEQMVGLMVDDLPGPSEKDVIINKVFDHLLVSPVDRGLPDVLQNLLLRSQTTFIPCSSYILIFGRLFQALPSLSSDMETLVLHTTGELKQNAAAGCVPPEPPTCPITSVNATEVCAGVNSNELNVLSAGLVSVPCNISLEQFACSPLTGFTAENLAELLMCQLSSNSSYSKEIWKLLLTNTNDILDQALVIFSSMAENMPIRSESMSQVLDVIGELRLEQSSDQWNDIHFISMLVSQNLRPFLPYASPILLQCVSSKNLSCQTYQQLLEEFSLQFHLMNEMQRRNMVDFFILPFLRRNTTDPGCVFSSNNSTEWLLRNFGLFAQFVPLRDLLSINSFFDPLENLVFLSAEQMVGLMVDDLPGPSEKDVIINKVFDHLLVSPVDRGLPDVLQNLLLRSQTTFIPCSSYILIFGRLFQALPSLSSDMETLVLHTTGELKQNAAAGCVPPEPPTCPITSVNATEVCAGVNSNELNVLSAGLESVPCNISLEQFACSPLTGFTAENLAELLMCQLSSNSSYSKEIWKLLLTNTNDILDQALVIFSSMAENMPIRSESMSQVLDVIGELRLEQSPDQWNDIHFISMLVSQNLRPFLPYASPILLQCVSSKNLSCQTYQQLLEEFSLQFHLMNEMQRRNMVDFFILPFLRRNTTDPGCVFSSNNSTEWLLRNFGLFAQFVPLRDLLSINSFFDPLENLVFLSAEQMVGLMVDDLPGPSEKDVIINKVFDHLLVSPVDRGLIDVLELLFAFSEMNPLSCPTNLLIFKKLDQILRSSPGDLEPILWASVYNLNSTAPADCSLLPVASECQLVAYNESRVCNGVDSSLVQQYLNNADASKTLCDFSIREYACTPMLNISVENLVSILECQSSADVMISPDTWKLFLIRVSHLLDSALSTLSIRSMWWNNKSASIVLDVLRELRLDRLADDTAIAVWFAEGLRPLLPFASRNFLQCLSGKNFSCQNFQRVVAAFDAGFTRMDASQCNMTVTEFILPFLSRETPDVVCVSSNSSLWLISNVGQFSALLSLNQLISLNSQINLLETLVYLSPEQLAGLMVDDLPGLPEKEVVINKVFDHLTASPQRSPDVLHFLLEMSKMRNISCVSYKTIFHRLDHLIVSVAVDLETFILKSRGALLKSVPPGCVSYSGKCDITPVNETSVCTNVNSSALLAYLSSAHDVTQLCDFSITQYSCAELTDLSSQDLRTVLLCSLNGNETVSAETWKLFTQKVDPVLGPTLDLLADTRLNQSHLSVTLLNMIGEVTLSTFSSSSLTDDLFVQRWFHHRLHPFLPSSSEAFLSCLATKDFSCDTFRTVVNSFSQSFNLMSTDTRANVYVDFIKVFLSLNTTEGCVNGTENSSDWLIRNFGDFSVFTTITDLQTLNPTFNVLDTLSLLSVRQLVEVSSTPGLLSSSAAVHQLLLNVPDSQFTSFYVSLSTVLQAQGVLLSPPVQEAFLQQVFDRANLTTIPDAELQVWILNILPPFIANMTVQHVTSYFNIVQERPCPVRQQAVQLLNTSISTFQPATQDQIYQLILTSLQGPTPLRCYGNQSYYSFLESAFMSFQFPNLSTFLSLMPPARVPELMASISPAEISSFLTRPNTVDDGTKVCQLLAIYPKTPQYLQMEPVGSDALARQVLSCVWPQVLRVENQSEVNQWFDNRLVQYLPFLTSALISPDVMRDASCLSFRKFVSVMGKYNYSVVSFSQRDIYSTIQVYLNTTSSPKCYNSSHPDLQSTAWFADYIGMFLSFITLEDLQLLFGSSQLQPFTVNLENLQLFNQMNVPDNVTEFYMTLLLQQDPFFNAFYLPVKFRCLAPASSFLNLTMEQLMIVSPSMQNCTNIQPDVSAALAVNADFLNEQTISALGQSCASLSTAQLSAAGGRVLLNSLPVLKAVIGWNHDQAIIIIQTLLSSGLYQFNSASSLQGVGSLIIGVSTSIINIIPRNEVLASVQSASAAAFLAHVTTAPVIVQQSIVNQIIAVDSSSDVIIRNVPDVLATEIPRNFLTGLSSSPAVAQTLNLKNWKQEQAVLLFETVATEITNPDDISFQVLQGFTCTRIQGFEPVKINQLIRGCRKRGNETIVLKESQLTCMYQYIKNDPSMMNDFSQYPAGVLLYYNYSLVSPSLCPSYFSAVGKADFSVLSSTLSFRKQMLLNNAMGCLGISGYNISREQLDVLGSMCCLLSSDYILNSDPYVLEKLKQCPDLSQQQISAIETVLLTGNTSYGPPDAWNKMTLENLEILPLYVTSNIWAKFTQTNKQKFLKTFIHKLRNSNRVSEKKIMNMMNQWNKNIVKRSIVSGCTVGQITQVEVYSDMFPFDYDVTQFNACLSIDTLKNNLEAVTDKVHEPEYQRVLLNKLNQAYPHGLSDERLQVLGSTSRAATPDDITKWNVTKIDTFSSLMNSRHGEWDPEMVTLIVSKYLSVSGNSLSSSELNSLGSNICALNTSVLNNITAASLERAASLSLTNCSLEKKKILFAVAQSAFSATNTRAAETVSLPAYQLLQDYLGGANITFVRKLVNSKVNMDVPTFISLEQNIINELNVTDVKSLLGVNVANLKMYESASQIQEWIKLQLQSELDALGIDLRGGRIATATAKPASNSTTKAPSGQSSTVRSTVTASTTAGSGSRVWPPVYLQLLLLAVTMVTLQLLH